MLNFLKNSFILIIGNLLAGFLGYVFHLIVSRLLSISEYGELQSLVSLISVLAVPSAAISYFTIKHSAEFYGHQDYMGNFSFYNWLRKKVYYFIGVISIFFVLFLPLLKNYLHLNSSANLLIIWLVVALNLMIAIKSGILNGWQNFKSLSLNSILAAGIKLIVGITLVSFLINVSAALTGFLAGSLFSFIFLKLIIYRKLKTKQADNISSAKFEGQKIQTEIQKIIIPILFFSLFLALLNSIDMLMVKNLLDSELAGYYGAFNILGKIIFWASSSIIAVILPMACASNSQSAGLDKKILFYAKCLILLICLSGLAAYLFFPGIIINLLFGPKYLMLAGSLWPFALIALALSLITLEANLAYARSDFKISYILLLTILLEIMLVSLFHQTIFYTALMVAAAFFAGYIASLIYNKLAAKKLCQQPLITI
ncbi:MAG: oligosaccharide flippase family protein [Candidatus Parcubacteria bacterium]|nr:oligosaccharide flippase family protein [Candidatus Parcubacteria bacterium]